MAQPPLHVDQTHKHNAESILGGGISSMTAALVPITSAQLLAIGDTPIQLLPAPGAGKLLVPNRLIFVYHFGTVRYDNTFTLKLLAGDIDWFDQSSASLSLLGESEDAITTDSGLWLNDVVLASAINAPLMLGAYGNCAGGDGTLSITIVYQIVTV